jgi:hypothetical protein
MRAHSHRIVPVLRTYRYVDKDPAIDVMRTALQDAGIGVEKRKLKIAADIAGLSVGCLLGLFHGGTRTPQHRTVMGLMTAFGYQERWELERKIDIEKEREVALAWAAKQNTQRKKKRASRKHANGKANGKAAPNRKAA